MHRSATAETKVEAVAVAITNQEKKEEQRKQQIFGRVLQQQRQRAMWSVGASERKNHMDNRNHKTNAKKL